MRAAVEHGDGCAAGRERVGARGTDDARADDGDVKGHIRSLGSLLRE
jgi:hypothetical protein